MANSIASIGDVIPQLANLTALTKRTGAQNFTHCCLVAANQSLLSLSTPAYLQPSTVGIPALRHALSEDPSFSCGDPRGVNPAEAPIVRVPYKWCVSECPGWEMSSTGAPQQWVGPLVQFILPSLAICLSIPRASKLRIPGVAGRVRPWSLVWFATSWIRLLWTFLLTFVDAVLWLSICFAFTGPMLLSAMYEYILDRKVLDFLDDTKNEARAKRHGANIPPRLTAQLLLAVVAGNLRICTSRRISVVSQWDSETRRRRISVGDILKDNTWSRVMATLDQDESDIAGAWPGGKVRLSTKLKSIVNSQARSVCPP
jgi:hypothetical protein